MIYEPSWKKSEEKGIKFLESLGYSCEMHTDNRSPEDIIATKDGVTLAVNVKGENNFILHPDNIGRLINTNRTPAYLFVHGEEYALFILKESKWAPYIDKTSRPPQGRKLLNRQIDQALARFVSFPITASEFAPILSEFRGKHMSHVQARYYLDKLVKKGRLIRVKKPRIKHLDSEVFYYRPEKQP